ncbi:beta-ketoacyl synthase N-terminal-like domain-containing protein [Fulvimarina sp. MAC8]|uniref:type I polyketide synthase n=1 Tax=Fulvimarina sp. MAC8 TaxID=3162874 RepID=UPI0032EC36A0
MRNVDANKPAEGDLDQAAMTDLLASARARIEELQNEREEKVAIIGMAGRFPGAEDIDAFWRLLDAGQCGLRSLSVAELQEAGVDAIQGERGEYVPVWGGFDDPTGFDAEFFGYSPRDAALLDPQQRVFLECAYHALEHSGHGGRDTKDRVGVFAAGSLNSYFANVAMDASHNGAVDPLHAGLSNVGGMMASRVAYHLDLRGPSVGIQATCSSALVAVHLSMRALLARETDIAIAGAASVLTPRPIGYTHSAGGIAASDGTCRPFDAAAGGTVFTNGVGALVLKRLGDATKDGDTIYAIIRGSAIGNDGSAKVGVTAPSVSGQAAVLQSALETAAIDPASIDYFEAHGTGTALGDPIEIDALNRIYGKAFMSAGRTCAIGSVKGNLGHMDAAAGMGGIIKAILAMQNGKIPPSINFDRPNPRCRFDAGPFRVAKEALDWPETDDRPRRAAISAFGMGGANAHLIIEQGSRPAGAGPLDAADIPVLLPLSARNPEALEIMRHDLATHLEGSSAPALADAAYTLQTGRRDMPHRLAVLARQPRQAIEALRAGEAPTLVSGQPLSGEPSLIFLFPGQGVQYRGIAGGLFRSEPVFREALEACLDLAPNELDLRALLLSPDEADPHAPERTQATQPALFAFEYALARMLCEKGLAPRALLGHSIGEYAAACLAGVFTLEDAMHVVCERGRLMQSCEPGSMLSVALTPAEAQNIVSQDVELAAINGPRSCVLAGTKDAIAKLADQFDRSGLGCRLLRTSHAFHSFMMEPVAEEFAKVLATVALNRPQRDIVSNVTGNWLTDEQATDPAYWVEQMRRPVQFGPGIASLMTLDSPVFLECGPGSTLTRLAHQQSVENSRAFAVIPEAQSSADTSDGIRLALGALWTAGLDIDWARVQTIERPRRVGLPGYPFQRRSHWIAPPTHKMDGTHLGDAAVDGSLRLKRPRDWFSQPVWSRKTVPAPCARRKSKRWLLINASDVTQAAGEFPAGVETIAVERGQEFAALSGGYVLDFHNADHYRSLFADLAARDSMPDQIVCAAGLADGEADAAMRSAIALGQALAGLDDAPGVLTIVGSHMHRVIGNEETDPRMAGLPASLIALSQEIGPVECRSLDLADRQWPVAGLAGYLASPFDDRLRVAALRNSYLWVAGHEAMPLEVPETVPALQKGATYLVAGDVSEGLGMVYARAIVRDLQGKAIIVTRPGLPAPSEWEGWLATHTPHEPICRLIRSLRQLGNPGEDFLVLSGALDDADWLKASLSEAQAAFGSIQGVFECFAMGDAFHCPLGELDAERLAAPWRAKAGAISALSAALEGLQPQFVLVQSSLSTLVGGPGLVAYAGANGFLDAFVEARTGRNKPVWQAINWDHYRPDELDREAAGGFYANALDSDEVWRSTQAVLANPHVARAIVSPFALAARIKDAIGPQTPATVSTVTTPAPASRPSGKPFVAPGDEIEVSVAKVMGELLGIEKVGADDNFFELGGHSLLAIQVVTRLRNEFGIDLPMRALLFEAPTVSGIASVLREAVNADAREAAEISSLLDEIEESSATARTELN